MGCRRVSNLLLSSFLVFTATFQFTFSVDDHSDDGSISIDCGSDVENFDIVTERHYNTDKGFVETGYNKKILDGRSQNLPPQVMDSRVFTKGKRNCYVLRLRQGGNFRYLIRALFRYGNYDEKDQKPEFDLYIGINKWKTVIASDPAPDNYVYHEIIYDFPMSTESVDVCLVNIGRGTPFISALELRPIMDSSIYRAEPGFSLSTAYRYDFGYRPGKYWDATNLSSLIFEPEFLGDILQSRRYKDDPYDRIWSQYNDSDTSLYWWFTVTLPIRNNAYSLPQDVWKTLGQTPNESYCINVAFSKPSQNNTTPNYYAYFHFADFYSNETRDMSISHNGAYLDQGPIFLPYMEGLTKAYSIPDVNVNEGIDFSICSTSDAYPTVILNAIELYEQVPISNIWTNPEDDELARRSMPSC